MSNKNCYICNVPIKSYWKLCSSCNFDPEIMISTTEVKKRYKLTDDDLDNENLFFITFEVYHTTGTKYVAKEIHKLAKKITAKLPDNDKRKIAFLKQEAKMNEIKEQSRQRKERYKSLVETVNSLVTKLDEQKYLTSEVNAYILELINGHVDDPNIRIFETSIKILDYVKLRIDLIKRCENRKKRMDAAIESNFEEIYTDKAKERPEYKDYIDSSGIYDKQDQELRFKQCFNNIKAYVDEIRDIATRKETIDNLIESKIDKNDWEKAKRHLNYTRYINKNSDLDKAFTTIKKDIDDENLKNKQILDRKAEIDKIIEKKFQKMYAKMAKDSKEYSEYVYQKPKKRITLEETINVIVDDITTVQQQKSRKSKLDYWINKNIPVELRSEVKNDIYQKFIKNGDVDDIEDVKKNIKEYADYIISKNKRANEIDSELKKHKLDLNIKCGDKCKRIVSECKNIRNRFIENKIELNDCLDKIKELFGRFDKVNTLEQFIDKNFRQHKSVIYNYPICVDYLSGEPDVTYDNVVEYIRDLIPKVDMLERLINKEFMQHKSIIYDYYKYQQYVEGRSKLSYDGIVADIRSNIARRQYINDVLKPICNTKQMRRFRQTPEYKKFVSNNITEQEINNFMAQRYGYNKL